jgi:hypothetical protein
MAATLVESGLVVGRLLKDMTVLPRQILLYRDYIRAVFGNRDCRNYQFEPSVRSDSKT